MSDLFLFKQKAAKELPEGLYQKLEPHLDLLLDCLIKNGRTAEYLGRSYLAYTSSLSNRYDEIRREFEKANETKWTEFAKERWPEVEQHFDLSPPDRDISSCHRGKTLFDEIRDFDEIPF